MLVLAAELGPLPEQDVLLRHLSRPIDIIHIGVVLTSAIFFAPHFCSVHNITWPSGLLSTSFLAMNEEHSVNWDQIPSVCYTFA